MIFPWSLIDNKSPQATRTLFSILVDLDNAVVWMVSTSFLISKPTNFFTNPLRIVPSALITTGITVTFMFHSFCSSQARSGYSSLFSPYSNFTLRSAGTAKSTVRHVLFLLTIIRSGFLGKIRKPICISKSQRTLYVSFSRTNSGLCIYHLFVW